MSWNHEKDPQRKGHNDPEKKPEFPPKRQVSDDTLRRLGRTAIKGDGKK